MAWEGCIESWKMELAEAQNQAARDAATIAELKEEVKTLKGAVDKDTLPGLLKKQAE